MNYHGFLQTFVDYIARFPQSLRGHRIYGPMMMMLNSSSTICEYEPYLYVVLFVVLAICNYWAWQSIRKDKGLAENDEWRTSQNFLLCQAWLGGVGGWLSMKYYRHKTSEKKKPAEFRAQYECRCICNLYFPRLFYFQASTTDVIL